MATSSIIYKPISTTVLQQVPAYTTNVVNPVLTADVSGVGGKSYLQSVPGTYIRKDDTISIADHKSLTITKNILEVIVTTDIFSNNSGAANLILEVGDVSDSKSIKVDKAALENLAVQDSYILNTLKTPVDNIANSETITKSYEKNILETLLCSDNIDVGAETQSFLSREDDFLILREDGFFTIRESNELDILLDTGVLSDSSICALTKVLSDTISTSDQPPYFTDNASRTLDTSFISDITQFNVNSSYSEITHLSESLTRIITKIIVDSASAADTDSINNSADLILREDGFFILREDNSNIFREGAY